jgi:hypothetical protein
MTAPVKALLKHVESSGQRCVVEMTHLSSKGHYCSAVVARLYRWARLVVWFATSRQSVGTMRVYPSTWSCTHSRSTCHQDDRC